MESAWPRTMAASLEVSLRGGSGRRALFPATPGRSAAKDISRSGLRAIARKHPVTARLKGSVGLSLTRLLPFRFDGIAWLSSDCAARLIQKCAARRPCAGDRSAQGDVDRGFRQLHSEAALIEFRNNRALKLVALVDECKPKRKADILEYLGVFRPCYYCAR